MRLVRGDGGVKLIEGIAELIMADMDTGAFWNMSSDIMMDYEDHREWLRVDGNSLTI